MRRADHGVAGGVPAEAAGSLRYTALGESPWRSAAYRRMLEDLERFARDGEAAVLLEGECGTGKTRLADYLHTISPRRYGPYVRADLAALPDQLAASELFGYVPGAFTGARAKRAGLFMTACGGTLLLDEIGKASLYVQQSLLHAIEYRELRPLGADREITVDARIVATTNVPLASLVEEERFLSDLYSRLLVFRVAVPPLRERRADIPRLVQDCVAFRAPRCRYSVAPVVHGELMEALKRAEWPYNLRQLDATMHRLLIEADLDPELTLDLCRGNLAYLREESPGQTDSESAAPLEQLITRHGGVSGAARLLGVDRTTIYRRLERQQKRAD